MSALPRITVQPAQAADKPVIANLVQLYLYDMTGDLPFPIERDGRFAYDFLDRFWQHPYLIFAGDELAGFALVVPGSPVTTDPNRWFMAEFFILNAYRRQGAGTAALADLLHRHPGLWQIGTITRNDGARRFWTTALALHAPVAFLHDFDGETWLLQHFDATDTATGGQS